ncbi:MAG: hypothetical protein PHX83_11845 [Acidobacteriia bacterium]|nr:hypothetical protein [Terriglobia bacterium]
MNEILADVEQVRADPYALWLGGGDYADYIGYTDKRFDPDCVPDNIKVSDLGMLGKVLTGRVAEIFDPIKHKCLGLLYGNHEKKYQNWENQASLHADLCEKLGVPNMGYSAIFDIEFHVCESEPKIVKPSVVVGYNFGDQKNIKRRVYDHHGAGFATTPAGKLKRLIDFMYFFEADLYFVGHVHDQSGKRIAVLGGNENCDDLSHHERLGMISGSYLKTYKRGVTTYGEMKGYAPTILGSAIARVNPVTGKFRGEI